MAHSFLRVQPSLLFLLGHTWWHPRPGRLRNCKAGRGGRDLQVSVGVEVSRHEACKQARSSTSARCKQVRSLRSTDDGCLAQVPVHARLRAGAGMHLGNKTPAAGCPPSLKYRRACTSTRTHARTRTNTCTLTHMHIVPLPAAGCPPSSATSASRSRASSTAWPTRKWAARSHRRRSGS